MEILLLGLAVVLGLMLLAGLIVLVRRWRLRRRRILWEDALKQICSARNEGRSVTPAEIGGRLGLSSDAMLLLAQALEADGLVRSRAGRIEPTEAGEQLGLRILRGHRLWEQFLSSDGQVPLGQLHGAAERAEHDLASHQIDALADHLGHPATDPHGDAVPDTARALASRLRTPLTDWPLDRLAVVDHVEDEPHEGLRQALAAGLHPGTVLRVVERNAEAILCETHAGRCTIPPAVAMAIDVRPAADGEDLTGPMATLAGLPLGETAEIRALSDRCTGLARRRLLDLGFTKGARVRAVLSNVDDEAHGYEIRGTMIALRKEQAAQILINPLGAQPRQPVARQQAQS